MLAPDTRALYLAALQPPRGCVLEGAVATTFSLDLGQLLGFPVALALGSLDAPKLDGASSVGLLEAMRRTADRLVVFADATHIHVPREKHVLYGLLEPVVVPVCAPGGGAFHPKLWVLCFRSETSEELRVRVLVLSRNLSPDRSWDVALSLEGRVLSKNRKVARPLLNLLDALAGWSVAPVPETLAHRVEIVRDRLARVDFDLPDGFEELVFHVFGTGPGVQAWPFPPSKRLVVVSPFVTSDALVQLAQSSTHPHALISRSEELDQVSPSVLKSFENVYTLHENAQSESGEDDTTGLQGLHAKIYLAEQGWYTSVFLGSANATHPALLSGSNVEVLAELRGKTSQLAGKGIDGFLDAKEGLGRMLMRYEPPTDRPVLDEVDQAAEHALDAAAVILAKAGLRLAYTVVGDGVVPRLMPSAPFSLPGIGAVTAWLVTVDAAGRTDASALVSGTVLELPSCSVASATRFVSFELASDVCDRSRSFVLLLECDTIPSDRDAHLVRLVIDNQQRFVEYLYALLGWADDALGLSGEAAADASTWNKPRKRDAHGLLEQLVRAKARTPERLAEVRRVVDALCATEHGRAILPDGFEDVWSVIMEDR